MNTFLLSISSVFYKYVYIFVVTIFFSGCNLHSNEVVLINGMTMGTTFSIQLINDKSNFNKKKLEEKINDILVDVNNKMSTWDSDSEISKINKMSTGQWIYVSPDTLFILALAKSVSKKTNGAFDVTTGNLIKLWGFETNEDKNYIPDEQSIKQTTLDVGYNKLLIDDKKSAVYKKSPFKINLSAIAKGYAVDKISEYLNKNKYSIYLVEVGGEIRVKGKKGDAKKWKIAIETPSSQVREVHNIINITDHAIATSGDYRNYFEIEGKRYSHIIDPIIGKPITHNLASVTVISDTVAIADAVATALMVMGAEKGYKYCENNSISAYFIYKQGGKFKVYVTSQFKKYIQ